MSNNLTELIEDYISDVESGIKYLELMKQDHGYGKDRLRFKAKNIKSLLAQGNVKSTPNDGT